MERLFNVALNDFRLVFRDKSLRLFLVLPLLNVLVIRYGLPIVVGIFESLTPYIPFVIMLISMQGALAFGFIFSMVLIDEKDTSVNKVYGILPVSGFWFTLFRLTPAFLLSSAATFFVLLAEPFYDLPISSNLLYSALAGLTAPQMILFVAIMADNKIEAMTWQKLFNIPISLPILAFFVPPAFSVVFALLPTYWAFQGLYILIEGGGLFVHFAVGFVYSLLIIQALVRLFLKRHFR